MKFLNWFFYKHKSRVSIYSSYSGHFAKDLFLALPKERERERESLSKHYIFRLAHQNKVCLTCEFFILVTTKHLLKWKQKIGLTRAHPTAYASNTLSDSNRNCCNNLWFFWNNQCVGSCNSRRVCKLCVFKIYFFFLLFLLLLRWRKCIWNKQNNNIVKNWLFRSKRIDLNRTDNNIQLTGVCV